jgi:hypothetical protein
MVNIPGTSCAAALAAVRLPFEAIVDALMTELGLTYEEAVQAAAAAGQGLPDTDCVHHANA